jgi:hypothetical protein
MAIDVAFAALLPIVVQFDYCTKLIKKKYYKVIQPVMCHLSLFNQQLNYLLSKAYTFSV